MVVNKYTTSVTALAIDTIEEQAASSVLVDAIIEQIPLSDFTEVWGLASLPQEVDYQDYFLSYNVAGSFERELTSGNQWHTRSFEIEVNDLVLYNGEGEEMIIPATLLEKLSHAIQNNIEI